MLMILGLRFIHFQQNQLAGRYFILLTVVLGVTDTAEFGEEESNDPLYYVSEAFLKWV